MSKGITRSDGSLRLNKIAKMDETRAWLPVEEGDFLILENRRTRFSGNVKQILPLLPSINAAWATGVIRVAIRRPGVIKPAPNAKLFFFGFCFDNEADATHFRLILNEISPECRSAGWLAPELERLLP